jgi:hypothetical protein
METMNNQTLISDYLNVIDLKYDWTECRIISTKLVFCDNLFGLITSHSIDLKCYTYLSKLTKYFDNTYEDKSSTYKFLTLQMDDGYIYVHDPNLLPTFPNSKLPSLVMDGIASRIFYEKIRINLLPPPYETDCFDYSGSIRSQAECINEILIDEYLNINKCLPKNAETITYFINYYNYSKFEHKFCSDIDFENNTRRIRILRDLRRKCRKACHEEIFEIWYSNQETKFNTLYLTNLNSNYIVFENNPEMTFILYLVNFGGLLGLWHGLSIKDLKNFIFKFINKIFIKDKAIRKFRKCFTIIKISKNIKAFLKIQVK